jgi:hypothetical protein
MRASAPVISVALPSSEVLDPKQILYICTLTYSSTPKSSMGGKKTKKRKEKKKALKLKIKQLFNNMNCTKLVHSQLQKLRCIDSKGTYINSAKTYYCQSTIVADFWSSILLLLLLITVCQLGLK